MAVMARRARRAPRPLAPQLERLEFRELLSSDAFSGTTSNLPDPARSLLVGFKAGTSTMAAQAALRAVKGSIALDFPGGPSVVEFPSSGAMTAALGRLKANRLV